MPLSVVIVSTCSSTSPDAARSAFLPLHWGVNTRSFIGSKMLLRKSIRSPMLSPITKQMPEALTL